MGAKKTTKQFIQDAIQIHENEYNYSKVNYIHSKTKIIIICKTHGEFEQKPNDHLQGKGCSKCYGNVKYTTNGFITQSIKIHGNEYDYSKVNYVNTKTKIKIICKTHGEFEQKPCDHLEGKGCFKCYGNIALTTNEFIDKSIVIYGDKYDYSKVKYINNRTKVQIICETHGEFYRDPYLHLRNYGCPKCLSYTRSRGETRIDQILSQYNIKYYKQHKFIDCRNIRSLPFDFYIPTLNICIEFDGSQHIYGWGYNAESLKSIQQNDRIKSEYCDQNNIKLIRIPHTEFYNIEHILSIEIISKI